MQLGTQSLGPPLQFRDQQSSDKESVIKRKLSRTGIYFVETLSLAYTHPVTTTLGEGQDVGNRLWERRIGVRRYW